MKATYTVYYRQSGTANFQWKKVFERYTTKEAAVAKKAEISRMGYLALYAETSVLDAVGLPETFEA